MNIHNNKRDRNTLVYSSGFKINRWWRTTGVVFLLAILILLLSFSIARALVAGQGFMWTVLQSAPVELEVCWENPSDADPLPGENDQTSGWQRREWVRLALKRTWEREARIIFVGWQQCQDESNPTDPPHTYGPRRPGTADENIKILITTTGGGQNPAHGSWGDYQQSGLILNLHCGSQACIEYLAIHEFGHALGLYHGEERSDWPTDIPGCPRQDYSPSWPWWPIYNEMLWGAPDPDSVMAYCSGGPTSISPGDVAGITRAYDRHLPGTLLSLPGSLCLSSHANAANGDSAFGWACDEAYDDQEWRYDVLNRALYIQWPADPTETRRCLDVDTTTYSNVQTWDCHYGSNQQWQFKDVLVRGYGGLCLTRSVSGRGALTMETCNGAERQLWRVDQGGITGRVQIRSATGDLCLTNDGGSGSDALAEPCTTHYYFMPLMFVRTYAAGVAAAPLPSPLYTPNGIGDWVRDFYLGSSGKITIPDRIQSLCLDVHDVWDSEFTSGIGGPVPGRRVQFFNCIDAQLNQKWSFSGHVVSGNKCLSLSGSAVNNGANAEVTSCSTAPQQDWDYDW